jgi:hypothetical protein
MNQAGNSLIKINFSAKQPDQALIKLETAGSSSNQARNSEIKFKTSWKQSDQA